MLANVARRPCPCTFVPASSLIQLSVFLASTIGNRGSILRHSCFGKSFCRATVDQLGMSSPLSFIALTAGGVERNATNRFAASTLFAFHETAADTTLTF